MLSWCARCVYRSGCCTPTPSPNAGKINPHLMRTVWCFLWSTRFSIVYEAHGTELLIWLAIITFSHTKLITANILAGLEFFISSVLLAIFISWYWQRSIIRLSLLHFSRNSLIPIPWRRAGTRICSSANLLKCGFVEVQILLKCGFLKCRLTEVWIC